MANFLAAIYIGEKFHKKSKKTAIIRSRNSSKPIPLEKLIRPNLILYQ